MSVTRRFIPSVAVSGFGAVYRTLVADLPPLGPDEDELAGRAADAGLEEVDVLQVESDPASVICEAAETHDVDVVVVGSHDKGVLRRLVDPSVALAIVQGTYRPVLVVSGSPPAT